LKKKKKYIYIYIYLINVQLIKLLKLIAPQVSYNLVYNIVDEMLNYCNKKDDVGKISQVNYKLFNSNIIIIISIFVSIFVL